jgi:hypothetical protein
MIAIRFPGELVRRALPTLAVAAYAVAALGFSLPNLLESTRLDPGGFDFDTSANVVVYAGPQARSAGISAGDRIDYARVPPNKRYGDDIDGLREPRAGQTVSFVVDHHGRRRFVRLTAEGDDWDIGWGTVMVILLRLTAQKTIFLVLVLLASGLLLARPQRLTAAFFLFAAGNGVLPVMYSFLPAWGYALVMFAEDALAGMGAIGFLALAFYLDPKRLIGERLELAIAALLWCCIVLPLAISDAAELLGGVRPAWPFAGWLSYAAAAFCFIAGVILLLRVIASVAVPRALRLLAAVLAVVGVLTIVDWTLSVQLNSWYFANLPTAGMDRALVADRQLVFPWWLYNGTILIVRLLGSLLAFYIIIRAGVANAGPVYRRVVAYVIVASLVVAALLFANIALMPHFANYVPIVPLEILVALAVGYWVSGLRDTARCLSLAWIDAWNAWASGRSQEERDALSQALGLAERTRLQGIIAEVRAQLAFNSWRNGEDGAFEQRVDALQRVLRGRNMRGIGGFASAATFGERELRFQDDDLPEWKARAALVLCARTDDAGRARELALGALANADRAGSPALQVLASVAVAEACADQRTVSLERAQAIARDAGWRALSRSIQALRANSRDIGLLQTFVDVRLRKSRPTQALVCVSFFHAELRVNGAHVSLSEKQLELLLTVASARAGINDNDLLDAVWPESEGDAARNSLRVCLHGLRKSAGDSRIVARVGKGFFLHPCADVDLWRLRSLLSICRNGHARDAALELRGLCDALRAGEGRRATLGAWFFRFEQMLVRRLHEAERLLARDAVLEVAE